MTIYQFNLILEGSHELTEDMADALFAAGCDDATPGVSNGVFTIDFDRKAESLEAAIHSAVRDVKRAGYEVVRIEIDSAALRQSA